MPGCLSGLSDWLLIVAQVMISVLGMEPVWYFLSSSLIASPPPPSLGMFTPVLSVPQKKTQTNKNLYLPTSLISIQ